MNEYVVIGGTGKTGRRVVERLARAGEEVRSLSRPDFDWADPGTWRAAQVAARAAYVTYAPEVAFPGAPDAVAEVVERMLRAGTPRVVLLSGRGEPEARRAEVLVADLAERFGAEWAVARCAIFLQNFSEGEFADAVAGGELAIPAGDVREPFVDLDDVADVVTALLLGDAPTGRVYELTGPRLLTFAELAAAIARVTGRPLAYVPVTVPEFVDELRGAGLPDDLATGLGELFAVVLDGRNEYLGGGVREALGRAPRSVEDYVRAAAAAGAWSLPAPPAPIAP